VNRIMSNDESQDKPHEIDWKAMAIRAKKARAMFNKQRVQDESILLAPMRW
jgi:hypothetical protein